MTFNDSVEDLNGRIILKQRSCKQTKASITEFFFQLSNEVLQLPYSKSVNARALLAVQCREAEHT